MPNDNEIYYNFYYMIRAILFGGKFNEYLKKFKELEYDEHLLFLYYLNNIIEDNDSNFLVNKNTKRLIEDIIYEILKIHEDKITYKSLNRIANEVKINLNNANLYDEESYLMCEFSYKLGVKKINNKFSDYEYIIRKSIVKDYLLYRDMLFGNVDLNREDLNILNILSINTYLCDIEGVYENINFIENVKKVIDSTLSALEEYKPILSQKQTKLYKKNINKIKRRIK